MRNWVYQKRSAAMLALLTLVFFSANIQAQDAPRAQNRQPPFSLTIRAKEGEIKSGSLIWVDATVESKSNHAVLVYQATSGDMDQGGWVYQIDIRNELEGTPPKTKYAHGLGAGGSGGYVRLDPGKTLVHSVNVSKLYDLNPPGKYTIQFGRFDRETKTLVRSNTVTVTVTP